MSVVGTWSVDEGGVVKVFISYNLSMAGGSWVLRATVAMLDSSFWEVALALQVD